MPFALVLIGLLMIVSGARDTYKEFGAALIEDFTGQGNFVYWIVAILAIGSIGYAPKAQGLSRAFLALVLISMIISNRGVFSKLTSALASGPINPKQDTSNDSVGKTGDIADAGNTLAFGIVPGDAQGNFGKVANMALNIAKAFV